MPENGSVNELAFFFQFRLKNYTEAHEKEDHLIYAMDKKSNPWTEKGKCIIM